MGSKFAVADEGLWSTPSSAISWSLASRHRRFSSIVAIGRRYGELEGTEKPPSKFIDVRPDSEGFVRREVSRAKDPTCPVHRQLMREAMRPINREGDKRKPLLLDMLRVMRDKRIAHPAINLIPQKPDILNPSRLHRDTQVLDALGIAQASNQRLDIRLQGREDIIHLQRELKKLLRPRMARKVNLL